MLISRKISVVFSLVALIGSISFAEDSYRLTASYFVRSSMKFTGDNNKVGVLTKGSSFKVIKSVMLSNGSEALQIRVVGLTPSSSLNPSDNYWIYKSNNTHFEKLNAPNTEAIASQTICEKCLQTQPITESAERNKNHLDDVSKAVIEKENIVTTDLDEKIKKYSQSDKVKKSIEHAMKNKYKMSQGSCYRSVKKALLASKLIPNHYSDLAAINSKESLKKFGFINMLESEPYKSQIGSNPNLAPKGAVLVYSSGIPCGPVKDCGHVEIKTGDLGKPGVVSDYYSDYPISKTPAAMKYGTQYKLVGVMIKTEE